MKTNTNKNQKQNTGAQRRPEQSSTEIMRSERPKIDLALRRANRKLDTEKLIALLRSETSGFFELAEVVGRWVWITFPDKQPPQITMVLSQLGFHWNNRRQTWQHPCGQVSERADYDPRRKYRSYFPAESQNA